jgi:hypothetical protein
MSSLYYRGTLLARVFIEGYLEGAVPVQKLPDLDRIIEFIL